MSVTGFQRRRRMIAEMRAKAEAEAKVAEPTKKEIMTKLDELGIEYDKKAAKAELMKLLEGAE
jgi:phage shock protein A